MFVGFFTGAQRQQPLYLETTLIGEPGLTSFERNWTFLTGNGYLSSNSYQQFQHALAVGNTEMEQAIPHLQTKTPGYLLIDIDAVRRAGISPIPRF
jgi:hypothetical protein